MRTRQMIAVGLLVLFFTVVWVLARVAFAPEDAREDERGDPQTGVVGGPAAPAVPVPVDPDAVIRNDVVYTPMDVEIFGEAMAWAHGQRLDTMAIGEIMVRLGRRFVGATYTPNTLDPPGPERVIVNLQAFDCVTYLETMLAMSRLIRDGRPDFPAFAEELRRIRYRDGNLEDYASRLHYFSDWIADNERKGLVRDITRSLGGVHLNEPIDFMSSNVDAYFHLRDRPDRIERIRQAEAELSRRPRFYIPQDRIAAVADGIRDGDIIAATSSVRGLDIAHTGMALWVDGRLHLMHAPLIGSVVEISSRPLAARILRIDGQDGIMVARPL